MLLLLIVGISPEMVSAQTVRGWRLHRTTHFLLYTIDGTAGARDVDRVAAQLEALHAAVLAPLGLPPAQIIYPLYPSEDRFGADWWLFASLGHGDFVHGWGAVYGGDLDSLSPYTVTRAVVARAFPRAIPFLRWGLGDALGDRAAGVDAHRHLRALAAAGQSLPEVQRIVAPYDFGQALPNSYPVAVSFLSFLLETYGPAKTAAFVDRVSYQYFDFAALFAAHFGTPLGEVEQRWRERVADGTAAPVDLEAYVAVTRFVYRTVLAGNPARLPARYMLEPDGAVVVTEAFRATPPLRRLELRAANAHLEVAEHAAAQVERKQRWTTTTVRGIAALVVITPILLAVGWLLWPTVRAKLASRRSLKAIRGQARRQ